MRAARKNAQVLLFRAGGVRFGVFIAEVGRLVVETAVVPVPFAHPALAGLLDDEEEEAVPVFDLFGLIPEHRPPQEVRGARVALFSSEKGPVGLRMEAMEGGGLDYTFVSDPKETEAQLATVPPPLRAPITAVARDGRGPFFFFSPDAFLVALEQSAPDRPGQLS